MAAYRPTVESRSAVAAKIPIRVETMRMGAVNSRNSSSIVRTENTGTLPSTSRTAARTAGMRRSRLPVYRIWKVFPPGAEESGRSERKTKLGRSALPMPLIEPSFATPENAPFGTTPTTSISCRPSPSKMVLPSADSRGHSTPASFRLMMAVARVPVGSAAEKSRPANSGTPNAAM